MLSSDEEEPDDSHDLNYQRLHRLMVEHGTSVLCSTLDHFIPPSQLHTTLQTDKNFKSIKYALKHKIINQKQYDQLFPTNGKPNTHEFDITLLIYLLRNLCGLNAKSPWWSCTDNNLVPQTMSDLEADIVRIRNIRNKFNHFSNASLDKQEFQKEWTLLEEVLLRLAAHCGINDTKKKIDHIKAWPQDPILKNLQENTILFLQDYKDADMFVETGAYHKAIQSMEKNNVVVLTGHPGEGKTSMAARLALKTTGMKSCLMLKRPSDWHHVDLTLNIFKVVILDDIFGTGSLDQSLIRHWRNVLREINVAAKRKLIKVIISSRHNIFEESKEERVR